MESNIKKGTVNTKLPVSATKNYIANTIKTKIVPISIEFIPEYHTNGAACCDLKANVEQPLIVGVGETVKVDCGIKLSIPSGYEVQIRARSSLASKGIMVTNGVGTIDEDYTKNIQVLLTNMGNEAFIIERLNRIAQMTIKPVFYFDFEITDTIDNKSNRIGGFGSTGL